MIRKLFNWAFKAEITKLNEQSQNIDKLLQGLDVSVDVHEYRPFESWAVISLQGQKTDYLKFIDLRDAEIHDIARFLRRYEGAANIKIDASPQASRFLRVPKR